jgi:predicted nuclease of predicted toxin-antitoxin system
LRVLLDECVDSRLASHLSGVDVATVPEHGWGGVKNGELLALAQSEFDVFVTVDRNLSFQQHLPKYDIAVVLLVATSNRIDDLVALVPALLKSLAAAPKGTVTRISL